MNTTCFRSPAASRLEVHSVLQRLSEMRDRWWLYSFLFNVLAVAAASLAAVLILTALDRVFQLSPSSLKWSFAAWCALSVGFLGMVLGGALRRQRTLAAAARRLEMAFPDLQSDLINLVQLEERGGESNPFRQAAILEAAGRLREFPYLTAAYAFPFQTRWRLAIQTGSDVTAVVSVLLLLVSVATLLHTFIPDWPASLDHVLRLG